MNIPSARPLFDDADIENILPEIRKVLESGRLILGKNIEAFESLLAQYIGVKYVVTVNSGTSALEIPLRYFHVREKEVIVPTNSFVASANAVVFAGGRPVLADIEATTLCMGIREVEAKITSRTCGVIIVHIAGMVYPGIHELRKFCHKRKLFLLEDCAHALGAVNRGKKAGSFGDAGSFSFFPTKIITTGEGGAITTDDHTLFEKAISLRSHGVSSKNKLIDTLGYNWRMPEISAILGIHQLKHIQQNLSKRRNIAAKYTEALKSSHGIKLFPHPQAALHSYYKYPVLLLKEVGQEAFMRRMKEKGVQIGTVYYPPIHLQPFYQRKYQYRMGMFPVAENILHRTVCLPLFAQMTLDEIHYVLEALEESVSELRVGTTSNNYAGPRD